MTELDIWTNQAIGRWNPEDHTTHCRNCLNATVSRLHGEITVSCTFGHGESKELLRLIRKHGQGFREAKTCPDWSPSFEEEVK